MGYVAMSFYWLFSFNMKFQHVIIVFSAHRLLLDIMVNILQNTCNQ